MKKLLLIVCYIFISITSYSQTQLWGMTTTGGEWNAGCIFKTDGSGNDQVLKHSFFRKDSWFPKQSDLLQATDGKLYGMTSQGGIYNLGALFCYDPITFTYTKKIDFDGTTNGSYPYGSLIEAVDGKFYGMTKNGGINNKGVLFQFDPVSSTYIKKLDFAGATNGSLPQGSLFQAADGMLYGMTERGGTGDLGVLFQYNPVTSTYTKKLDFAGVSNGSYPLGSLMEASDGMLYGMTFGGGLNGFGVIFQYDIGINACTKKFDFGGTSTIGKNPYGSLIQATDGKLYGMTQTGGSMGNGVLFQFDFITSVYTTKVVLTSTSGGTGTYPQGSLIQASDGMLYGMTATGGMVDKGVLFQYNIATSIYTKKVNFDANGRTPRGSLIQASDGKLYGMTETGGSGGGGVLFQYDPSVSTYLKKIDFLDCPNGAGPKNSLMQATDKKFYGLTENGGVNRLGVLFQFDPATSMYVKKIDFDGATNGAIPTSNLIQTADGMLYGMTRSGGSNGFGVIFQFDPVTSIYTVKYNFDLFVNGGYPTGSLMIASDGMLYGMTSGGGVNSEGVLFQYDPLSSVYTKKIDFDNPTTGGVPYGALIQAFDGKLYGLTSQGGASNMGAIFQYDFTTSILVKKFDFLSGVPTGNSPRCSLVQATDGKLYGLTSGGGVNNFGVLFSYNPTTNVYTKKFDFTSAVNGKNPMGSLTEALDGNLYGLTSDGGLNNLGVFFQYNISTSTYTKKLDFNILNGSYPYYTNLIEIPLKIYAADVDTLNCAGVAISVPFSIEGSFDTGNIFTAELSDSTGSFISPVNIGSLVSTSAGIINAIIPPVTAQGNGYRIRVVSTNPAVIGTDNGSDIIINALPIVVSNASSSNVCSGSYTTLTGGGAVSYIWSDSVNDGIAFIPTTTNTYTVTGTDINTCTNSATITVEVNSLPLVPTISSNGPTVFCMGDSVILTSSFATSYLWSNGDTTQSVTILSSEIDSVTVSDTNGCSSTSSSIIVIVDTLPNVILGTIASPLCDNSSVVSLSGNPSGGIYSGTGVSGSNFDPSLSGVGTFTIFYSYTDINSCSNIDSQIVIVDLCSEIFELENSFINISPNPFTEQTTITFSGEQKNITIKIVDVLGKEIKTFNFSGKEIILEKGEMQKGIYFVQVVDGNENGIIKKIILQ